ncbi:MAG: hypothetical protein EBW88_01900, partial [Betaproteobacteria bacterium]|nr:hypothetical protein [Betaproteobacteria bacterium]
MSAHQAQVFAAVAARQAPASDQGLVAALRRHLFGSRFSSITTLILVLIFFQTIPDFIAWA